MFFLPVLFAGVCKAATVATVASTVSAGTVAATAVAVGKTAAAKAFVSGAAAAHLVKRGDKKAAVDYVFEKSK